MCLACLTAAAVAENETYGVSVRKLIDSLCQHIVGSIDHYRPDEAKTVEQVKKELQFMIMEDAYLEGEGKSKNQAVEHEAGTKSKNPAADHEGSFKSRFHLADHESKSKGHGSDHEGGGIKSKNYAATFAIFDTKHVGKVPVDEFKKLLIRYQLVDNLPDDQLNVLMAAFDPKKSGFVTLKAFIEFAEDGAQDFDDEYDLMSEDSDEEDVNLASADPPVVITKNKDCDWLLWFLWRQCCKQEPMDPESMITELQACCNEVELVANRDSVSIKDLWALLAELHLRGDLTRPPFFKGVQYFCLTRIDDPESNDRKKAAANDNAAYIDGMRVDYESLCRNVVRMGRAFNEKMQERRKEEDKKFQTLWAALQKELLTKGKITG